MSTLLLKKSFNSLRKEHAQNVTLVNCLKRFAEKLSKAFCFSYFCVDTLNAPNCFRKTPSKLRQLIKNTCERIQTLVNL